jgi:hypothetical protein
MGLLDQIKEAKGAPVANYARKGRHIVAVQRVAFSEGDLNTKPSFRVDGRVIHSYLTDEPHAVGESICVHEGMKYPESGMARVRRSIATLSDKSESEVTPSLAKEFCGPSQPACDKLVAFEMTARTSGEGKTYTLFEIQPLNKHDEKVLEEALAAE